MAWTRLQPGLFSSSGSLRHVQTQQGLRSRPAAGCYGDQFIPNQPRHAGSTG